MNVLTMIFILSFFLLGYRGYRKGFSREMKRFISLITTFLVLVMLILLVSAFMEQNVKAITVALAMLTATGLAYRTVKIFLRSIHIMSYLPLLGFGNRILGSVAGVIEAMMIFWLIYFLIESVPTGAFGIQIMEWTQESTILQNLYRKNFIMYMIFRLTGKN